MENTQATLLRIAVAGWPLTLAPQKSSLTNELPVLTLNYEGLTRIDKDLRTVPAAAERWQYNSDSTSISFTLRSGLTYSDGSPLRARDFVQAVYRVLDPRSPGNYQTLLAMIAGAEAIIDAGQEVDEARLRDLCGQLAVSAPDDRTIDFALTRPTPYFHTLASTWVLYPAKQERIDRGGARWGADAANHLGNGPFQMTTIDPRANLIAFKANEYYWHGRPKLDGVHLLYIDDKAAAFQSYLRGEVDILAPDPRDVPRIKADATLSQEFKEYPGACTMVLEFALVKAPFNNKLVREAFTYAFDRGSYIRDVLHETEVKTLTWIPPGYPGHDPCERRYDFDPVQARHCLTAAGFPGGQGLPEIRFSYSQNPINQARVDYIIQMYQRILGVAITPNPVSDAGLAEMRRSVETFPQIVIGGGWCADYPDPQNWLSVYWHSRTNIARSVGYKNEEADRLMDLADVETEPEKRIELYRQAQELIVGDVAQLAHGHTKNGYLIKPWIKGLDLTAQDWVFPGQVTSLLTTVIEKEPPGR